MFPAGKRGADTLEAVADAAPPEAEAVGSSSISASRDEAPAADASSIFQRVTRMEEIKNHLTIHCNKPLLLKLVEGSHIIEEESECYKNIDTV